LNSVWMMQEKGVILILIFSQHAFKKNMILVMRVNWNPQTGISRQQLQLLPQ
jgi:hypothetical protein